MKPVLAAVTALTLLTACQWTPTPPDTRETVTFATDPRILRGIWTGEVLLDAAAPSALTLSLTATYQNDSHYAVTGAASMGDWTTTVQGTVTGLYQYRYLEPQTSQVPPGLSLSFPEAPRTFISCPQVQQTANGVSWSCRYLQAGVTTPFTLTKGTP